MKVGVILVRLVGGVSVFKMVLKLIGKRGRGTLWGGFVEEGKIRTMAPVCFTAASEFSNFPAPARNGKTAHNSPYFLMEIRLRQCSLEPARAHFP